MFDSDKKKEEKRKKDFLKFLAEKSGNVKDEDKLLVETILKETKKQKKPEQKAVAIVKALKQTNKS